MYLTYKKFLLLFITSSFMILSAVSGINYLVDPMKVYSKSNISDVYLDSFSKSIINSKSGVLLEGIGERAMKMALSTQAGGYECVVMGTSNVVQISEIMKPSIIPQCNGSLLNLAVSICTMEDILIYSYMILNNSIKPKKVYIGVVEWFFLLDKYNNYMRYKKTYLKMLKYLDKEEHLSDDLSSSDYNKKKLQNLINIEYFYKSIKYYFEHNDQQDKKVSPYQQLEESLQLVEPFDFVIGGEKNVVLNDGSLAYTKSYIQNHRHKDIAIDKNSLQLITDRNKLKVTDFTEDELREVYSKDGEELFEKLVTVFKKNNIEVNLVITPIHFEKINDIDSLRKYILLDKVLRRFSNKNNIDIYGSFFPNELDCSSSEFYDSMHPKLECIKKFF